MAETKRRGTAPRRKTVKAPENALPVSEWANEAASICLAALALFLAASLFVLKFLSNPQAGPEQHPMGPVGHVTGTLLFGVLGWCAFIPSVYLLWQAHRLWYDEDFRYSDLLGLPGLRGKLLSFLGVIGVLTFGAAFSSAVFYQSTGGSLGKSVALPLVKFFGIYGAGCICAALFVASLALASGQSIASLMTQSGMYVSIVGRFLFITTPGTIAHLLSIGTKGLSQAGVRFISLLGVFIFGKAEKEISANQEETLLPKPKLRKNRVELSKPEGEGSSSKEVAAIDDEVTEEEEEPTHTVTAVVQRKYIDPKKQKDLEKIWKKVGSVAKEIPKEDPFAAYQRPQVSLLQRGEPTPGSEDDEELRNTSKLIENKLRDFGIAGKVTHIHPGPVITLYEYEPAPGVKVGKISSLVDDLAMGLKASSLRIIAPIPKRGTVGIEVPNRNREIVRLRDVLDSVSFLNQESVLSVALGKDTYGDPVVVDIASMPHLLIAGSTGTGKSVCINTLILSLLYRAHPSELGLIMIDPKILELSVYDDIPHLRVPVVTVPRQAKAVLEWAVNEMNRRYRIMQKFGVRNIDSYNRIIAGTAEPGESNRSDMGAMKGLEKDIVVLHEEEVIENGTVDPKEPQGTLDLEKDDLEFKEQLKPLAKIVIIIDELADLMLTVGRDIEELITRLAQKARASGIHLILATQRPSVDVITGLIKANFPARLSFRVSSRIDSRTILDSMGAERLLGKGDMLFMVPGGDGLRRIHGGFCSDNEVKAVVEVVKSKCKPAYDERIMAICQKALEEEPAANAENKNAQLDEYDEMYDKCVELVTQKGQASTSMLQRAFRLGYNRAARIIDMMEREGIIGPMDGAKPREVLIQTGNEEADRNA